MSISSVTVSKTPAPLTGEVLQCACHGQAKSSFGGWSGELRPYGQRLKDLKKHRPPLIRRRIAALYPRQWLPAVSAPGHTTRIVSSAVPLKRRTKTHKDTGQLLSRYINHKHLKF
jgi:hypothetical protein